MLDLMIHDIDILLCFVDSKVKSVAATGLSIMTDSVDIAHARIQFKNGTVGSLTSSRIAKDKVRKIKLFQKNMYITIDMLLTLSEVYRVVDEDKSHRNFAAQLDYKGTQRKIVYEKPEVQKKDPLRMELENFADSIRGNTEPVGRQCTFESSTWIRIVSIIDYISWCKPASITSSRNSTSATNTVC